MKDEIYTLALWHAKPGMEKELIEAWKAMGAVFAHLPDPPKSKGYLVQSLTDPSVFYSFGAWESLEQVQGMRNDPAAQAEMKRLMDLCEEAKPGSYRLVAEST